MYVSSMIILEGLGLLHKVQVEVLSKFRVWKAEVENQTRRKIKCLRTDKVRPSS